MKSPTKLQNDETTTRPSSRVARSFAGDAGRVTERGFSLLEAVIALLLMMIVAVGSASLFSLSIYNNSGGSDRATALAVAQQKLERLRNAQFNTTATDSSLDGGSTVQTGIVCDHRTFNMTVTIDDDPSTSAEDINPATNLKGIKVTVVPQSILKGWAYGAGGTITLMTQRSRTDR